MSLNDTHPTEYFGANPVTFTAVGAGNGTVQMTQERARRLIAEGVPEYKFTGLLPEEKMPDPGHSAGCSNARTGKCICDYLAQWDSKPAPAGATFTRSPELQELHDTRLAGKGTLQIPTADGGFTEFDLNEPATPKSQEPRMQLPVVIATGGDPAELAEKIVRQNPEYFGHIDLDGIYQSSKDAGDTVPREVWKQDLSDSELKVKYWHKECKAARRGFWIAVAFAAACAAGLGTALASAGVL